MLLMRTRPSGTTRPRLLITALTLALVLSLGLAGAAWAEDDPGQPSISGTVLEIGTEVPVADATVTLLRSLPFGTPGPPSGAGQTTTDENGQYAFADVEVFDDRHYSVIVEADGYDTHMGEGFVYDGSAPVVVDVLLESQLGDPVVTGVVIDAVTGLPIPQATVWVWYDPDSQDHDGLPGREVEEDGTFAFWGVEPDREFEVWAEAEVAGYPASMSEVLLYDGENPLEVEIVLTRQLQARGIDFATEFMGDFASGLTDIGHLSAEAQEAIEALAFYGVTIGYADGTYKPGETVMRSQMALFLARVIDYAVDTGAVEAPAEITDPGFSDTSALSQEAKEAIALLYTVGVTQGTTATTFSPYADVTRRDMASFMVRLQNLLEQDSYATGESFFSDVPDTMPRGADINALAAQGIAVGYGDGTYAPSASVLRSQMALFIMRHIDENVEAGRLPALGAPSDS